MKFKKAMLTKPGKFEIFEVEEEPGYGEVLIKIASCGLCNWELNFWDGNLNFLGYPHKLGHEFAGVVEALGEGCKKLKVGDKVAVVEKNFGGFAEFQIAKEESCLKLEANIDPKYAMGEPQKCVLTVLRAAAPEPGDYAVMLGCGPMGLWCIQALAGNMLGALIAIDIDDNALALAKTFGATHIINSKNEDVAVRIAEITGGHMADFLIEGTGVPSLINAAQEYMKAGRGSRILLMSSHHNSCPDFDFRKAVDKGLQIIAAHPPYSQDERDDFRRAIIYINNGTFKNKELVTHEFALADIQKAFEALEQKPPGFIKGIVVP